MVECPSPMKMSSTDDLPNNLQINTDLYGYFNKFLNLKEATKPQPQLLNKIPHMGKDPNSKLVVPSPGIAGKNTLKKSNS